MQLVVNVLGADSKFILTGLEIAESLVFRQSLDIEYCTQQVSVT